MWNLFTDICNENFALIWERPYMWKARAGRRWLLLFPDLRWLRCPSVLQSSTMQPGTRPQRRLQGSEIDKIKDKDKRQTILLFQLVALDIYSKLNWLIIVIIIIVIFHLCSLALPCDPASLCTTWQASHSPRFWNEQSINVILHCFYHHYHCQLVQHCNQRMFVKSATHYPTAFIPSLNSYPFIQTLPCCFKTQHLQFQSPTHNCVDTSISKSVDASLSKQV